MHLTLAAEPRCHLPAAVFDRLGIAPLAAPDDLADRLFDDWLYTGDALLVVAGGPGGPLAHWREAAGRWQSDFEPLRRAASLTCPFRLRLVGSGQLYAGLGLVAAEAGRLALRLGPAPDPVLPALHRYADKVTLACHLPDPLPAAVHAALPWLDRQRCRFDRGGTQFGCSDGAWYRLGNSRDGVAGLIRHCRSALAAGPLDVNASVAGPMAGLSRREDFRELHRAVTAAGGHCWLSEMGAASAAQLGAGAVSLAWAVHGD